MVDIFLAEISDGLQTAAALKSGYVVAFIRYRYRMSMNPRGMAIVNQPEKEKTPVRNGRAYSMLNFSPFRPTNSLTL
jgi:hypothetical protein